MSAFGPHIKPHGSEEASKSSGGVLIAPKILGVRANKSGYRQELGAGILQNSSKLHSYTSDTLLGPDWQRLESDTQLEEGTQTYGESL